MDPHEDLEVKKKVLRDKLPYLRQNLGDPSRYIPYLVQGGVLDLTDKISITYKTTSKEKLETLLQLLIKEREDVSTFDVFVDALKETRVNNRIALQLQRALENEKESIRKVATAGIT